MADCARQHFILAADLKKKIKVDARLLYLTVDPLERYLHHLSVAFFNPFDEHLLKLEAKRKSELLPFRMWATNYQNRKLK